MTTDTVITPNMDETEKRRKLQLLFLREDYTEDEARKMVALDEWLEKMREDAMRFPERQIVPPGTTDLADVKSQHEETLLAAAEAVYFENQIRLATLMEQSFSLPEMLTAVLQALLDVLETNGVDRLEAMTEISETVDFLRKVLEVERGVG